MAGYRIVRRRRSALTAAAEIVDPGVNPYKSKIALSGSTDWQSKAWYYVDEVGELRYYLSWLSNACSRVRLIASDLDAEGKPTGACSDQRVIDIVNGIAGGQLGQAQLIKRGVECVGAVGESWVGVLIKPGTQPDEWLSLSKDEVKRRGRSTVITLPSGEDYELAGDDSLIRWWKPHPRYANQADSPVRASEAALNEIIRATKTISSAAKSRLTGAGVLFVPQQMSLPAPGGPVSADKISGSRAPMTLTGSSAAQELSKLLVEAGMKAWEDGDSAAAITPIIATVDGEQIKNILHLRLGEDINDANLKIRNDAVARLALGLEVSPERLLGMGNQSNHWSAWSIGDTDVQMHICPMMELFCHAVYTKILSKVLTDAGIDPSKHVLWYDASGLTADPDLGERGERGYINGAVSASAYRDMNNLGDTGYDLVGGGLSEWQRWACDKVAQKPELLPALLPLLDPQVAALDFPAPVQIDSQPQGPPETNDGNSPDTEDAKPGDDQGRRGRPADVAALNPVIEMRSGRVAVNGRRNGHG